MAACIVQSSLSGVNNVNNLSSKPGVSVRKSVLAIQSSSNSKRSQIKRDLSVRAEYNNKQSGGGDADFLAGFVLGGAVFGTLALVLGPKISKAMRNENELGFAKPRRPLYYDESIGKWEMLHKKIGQLNSALEKVSSPFRGGKNSQKEPVEVESDVYGQGYGETL